MRVAVSLAAIAAVAIASAACGGDDGPSGTAKHEGAGAAAVAAYFNQEKDGGLLPGGTELFDIGIRTNDVRTLEVKGATARFCMPYTYRETAGANPSTRVYIAVLDDGQWNIQPQQNATSCEGVS